VIGMVGGDESFCLTYGDGVSDINIAETIKFHKEHGKLATVAAMLPPRRFGILEIEGQRVMRFTEKPKADGSHINGGFFVLSPKVSAYLGDDKTVWEEDPLQRLAAEGELHAYQHDGFFQPMDTVRDKAYLEELWAAGEAPWKRW
jgi:glucose-1-phosphate cytidylyltransferase